MLVAARQRGRYMALVGSHILDSSKHILLPVRHILRIRVPDNLVGLCSRASPLMLLKGSLAVATRSAKRCCAVAIGAESRFRQLADADFREDRESCDAGQFRDARARSCHCTGQRSYAWECMRRLTIFTMQALLGVCRHTETTPSGRETCVKSCSASTSTFFDSIL